MKTTIDKEFFKKWKDKEVGMLCKKKEYAEEFCKIMHEQGLMWCTGYSYLGKDKWHVFCDRTIYLFNTGHYTELIFPDISNTIILDFEDYIVKEERIDTTNNLPAHYNIAGIDTMNLILTICEHNNTNQRETFYLANTLKYLIRYKNKNGLEDLKKAKDYLNRLIEYTTVENLPFYDVDR